VRFAGSNSRELQAAVGTAFGALDFKDRHPTPEELAVLQKVLGSKDEGVARCAAGGIRTVVNGDDKLAIELLNCVDIGISSDLADIAFMNFAFDHGKVLNAITDDDIGLLLNRLMPLPKLDGHWVETLLATVSKGHATRLAKFFMDRVNRAADNEDWNYRPCNYGPYGHVALRFRESPDFSLILRQVSDWMKSRNDLLFMEGSAQLFDTMFKPFDDVLVGALQHWADIAAHADIQAISKILSQAHPEFVFQQRPFVVRFLERAKQFGKKTVNGAISDLFASTIRGVRSGTPGEPLPRDLQTKQEAGKALAELPRFSPAYELYEAIARHADESIKQFIRDGETFEE
jgi:hypothetical protein